MKGSRTFVFNELDQSTRDYLTAIGKSKGEGFVGIYSIGINFWWLYLIPGLIFLIGIPVVNLVDTFAEPKAQAMLQTSLFLVAGWFLLLAIRHGGFFSKSSGFPSFVFIDGRYYWNFSHYSVRVVNIEKVKFFEYHFNQKSNFHDFKLECDHGVVDISLSNKVSASQLYSFLFYKSAETVGHDKFDGSFPLDETFKTVSQEFVPEPVKQGNEKLRWLGVACFTLTMVVAYFVFLQVDISFRDDQIWQSINSINSDEKVYWLRIYLRDHRNTRHRDEAFKELGEMYKHAFGQVARSTLIVDKDDKYNADFISNSIPPIDPKSNQLAKLIPMAKLISVPDPTLAQGLQSVVLPRMLELQEPLLRLSVVPKVASIDDGGFIRVITDAFARAVVDEFGREYFMLSSSMDGKGHINILYHFTGVKDDLKIVFEVSYQLNPESEPTIKTNFAVRIPDREIHHVERAAKRLAVFTMGDRSGEWTINK